MHPAAKRVGRPLARYGWYIAATILLLAAPTHSFWGPVVRRQGSIESGAQFSSARPEGISRAQGSSGSRAGFAGSSSGWLYNRGDRFQARRSVTGRQSRGIQPSRRTNTRSSTRARTGSGAQSEGRSNTASNQRGRGPVNNLAQAESTPQPAALSDLARLEAGYQAALSSLLRSGLAPTSQSFNPFQPTPTGGTGGGGGSGGEGNGGDGDGSDQPDNSGDGTAGDSGGPSDPGDSNPGNPSDPGGGAGGDTGGNQPVSDRFAFLVLGGFPDGSEDLARRASRLQGDALLFENGFSFNRAPGIVGIPRNEVFLDELDHLVAADLNQDGLLDYVRSRHQFLGTSVEAYHRTASGQFVLVASHFFLFQSIRSLALFDFDGDGKQELAMIPNDTQNLGFYELSAGDFVYQRELTLPFEPGVLFQLNQGISGLQSLVILDNHRTQGRFLSSQGPASLLRPFVIIPERFQGFSIEAEGGEGGNFLEVQVFTTIDRTVVLRQNADGTRLVAALDTSQGVPVSIFGDHTSSGVWQLLYIP